MARLLKVAGCSPRAQDHFSKPSSDGSSNSPPKLADGAQQHLEAPQPGATPKSASATPAPVDKTADAQPDHLQPAATPNVDMPKPAVTPAAADKPKTHKPSGSGSGGGA